MPPFPIWQAWLQEFGWTSEQVPKRQQALLKRSPTLAGRLDQQPMFVFEEALKLVLWSDLVYDCSVEDGAPGLTESDRAGLQPWGCPRPQAPQPADSGAGCDAERRAGKPPEPASSPQPAVSHWPRMPRSLPALPLEVLVTCIAGQTPVASAVRWAITAPGNSRRAGALRARGMRSRLPALTRWTTPPAARPARKARRGQRRPPPRGGAPSGPAFCQRRKSRKCRKSRTSPSRWGATAPAARRGSFRLSQDVADCAQSRCIRAARVASSDSSGLAPQSAFGSDRVDCVCTGGRSAQQPGADAPGYADVQAYRDRNHPRAAHRHQGKPRLQALELC